MHFLVGKWPHSFPRFIQFFHWHGPRVYFPARQRPCSSIWTNYRVVGCRQYRPNSLACKIAWFKSNWENVLTSRQPDQAKNVSKFGRPGRRSCSILEPAHHQHNPKLNRFYGASCGPLNQSQRLLFLTCSHDFSRHFCDFPNSTSLYTSFLDALYMYVMWQRILPFSWFHVCALCFHN